MDDQKGPILYVLVVGFHHKKGCQIEYSFPPLVPGAPEDCPTGWKYLPTLALPDGSHNYDEDTAYFHLPSLTNPKETVFGISCFRQIPVEKLKNRTSDITRGTVQKSVCVLSKLPLYGHIQVKMALITHAYFDEGDFSKVSLLEDTYHHLNAVLLQNESPQTFVGLSARDFVLQWRHKAVLLFKLLLLEKRIIFYKSPVHHLCSTILTLISLQPEMIEKGLTQSACIKLSRPMSPMPDFSDDDSSPVLEMQKVLLDSTDNNVPNVDLEISNGHKDVPSNCDIEYTVGECAAGTEIGVEIVDNDDVIKSVNGEDEYKGVSRDVSGDAVTETSLQRNLEQLARLSVENCGFPLQIFTKGYLCLPYLSLPYMDLLADLNVRGYIVGATNVLFKQKRQLYDILVDIDNTRIECQDMELRKQLHLTTEDLRFADYIVKQVSDERNDVFLDGVPWEGGDDWIRAQFKIYMLCLLRTSLTQDGSREIDHFGPNFMSSWRETHNYKIWLSKIKPGILEVNPGHPFAGQLSVADMKLRLSHTMQNTEGGRKLNQVMANTGRAVATTSKAVGGALSQAKGAVSSWWSSLLISPDPVQKTVDVGVEEEQNDNREVVSKGGKGLNGGEDVTRRLGEVHDV